VQFGHEGRAPETRAVMARDDQAETARKVRLFNQAQGFGCIRYADHVTKAFFERRHAHECLERIVID
jgi:hypothetical protein